MYSWQSHPLYPELTEDVKKIQLYPAKECGGCSRMLFDVDWHEVTVCESDSFYENSVYKKVLKKLCTRCFEFESRPDIWGVG